MLLGPQKYNHRQLVKDLRGGDEDVCIFALRTIIQLERANLRNLDAIGELRSAIEGAQGNWSEETRFYANRALEHLAAIEKALSAPEEDEDLQTAELDPDDLRAEDPDVVVRCLRMIELQEAKEARGDILRMLREAKDPQLLVALLSAFGVVGEQSDLFELPRLGDNPNRRVRATYVGTIARIASEVAVGASIVEPFLKDRDGAVRARAIEYLGPADFGKVREALEATLASKEVADRAALASAVAAIRDDEVVSAIRALSEDPEDMVRLKLLESLDRADHPQKSFVIKKLGKDSSKPVRKVALEAQSRVDAERLLAMGGFQAPEGKRKGPTVEEALTGEELDPIDLEDLKKEDPTVKLQCLYKIREREYTRAHQAVFDLLGVTEDEEVLAVILRCLTVIGSARDADAVIHFLTHVSARVRAAAAEALVQLGPSNQILFLLLPMLHDDALEVQGVVARALRRFEMPEILRALGGMTNHKNTAIRRRTIFFLSHYSGDAVRATLQRMTRDSAPEVRQTLAARLIGLGDWADPILATMTSDPIEEVALTARQATAARQRHAAAGRSRESHPALDQLPQVAAEIETRAAARQLELEAEEKARREELAASAAAAKRRSGVGGIADDLTARKEREMIYLNRDNILAAMGKKLHGFVKSKAIQQREYDKAVFLVDKYAHLLKQGPTKEETGGLWGALAKMAGVEQQDERRARNEEKLRQAYIELAKVCRDLSYKQGVIHPELDIDYIELEQVERRIETLEG